MRQESVINIIGGGFSGLVTGHFLTKMGHPVRIFEKSPGLGGMIGTKVLSQGLVESAANSFLSTKRLEELAEDIGIELLSPKKESRARYIFRGRPRRWPLGFFETIGLIGKVLGGILRGPKWFRPQDQETVREWGIRVVGKAPTEYFLAPALQGIYAGDISRMSAELIFGARFRVHTQKGKHKGIVAARGGMGAVVEALKRDLIRKGAEFAIAREMEIPPNDPEVWIVCTSAHQADSALRTVAPLAATRLKGVEVMPVVTVTLFYPVSKFDHKGFGCLFPAAEGYRVLGVLYNNRIFSGRAIKGMRSETWIYGGARDPEAVALDDEEILSLIARERRLVYGRTTEPEAHAIHRWKKGIPHYDLSLERVLSEGLDLPKNVFLVGNYLGGLGLAKIVERAFNVASEVNLKLEKGLIQ